MTYIPPKGNRVGLNFTGEYVRPAGYRVGLEFSPSDAPIGDAQYVFPVGPETFAFGEASAHHQYRFLTPSGIAAPPAGVPLVELYVRYLRPAGIASKLAFGNASLLNWNKDVFPAGTRMDVHGQPTIYNLDRYLTAGGLPSRLAFGRPTIFNSDRYYNLTGFNALRLGTPFMQGGVVEVGVQPIAPPAAPPGPWVSRSPRTLSTVGIFREFPTNHLVGGTRWLTPQGFEATQWGERIIPESQSVFPLGMQGAFGQALVWNYSTLVRPIGFRLIEDQRFGGLFTWNTRQYVHVTYDPNDGLAPPPITGWTSIHNRNRVVTHHSTAPALLPRPTVELGARALLPAGIAAPTWADGYMAGMVAYRVRTVPPESIDAPYFSGWSRVHNDGRPLAPPGLDATLFGTAVAKNTRRYFPYIGGFDSAWYGYPMVADRIRTLSFEERYTIGAPVIQLPEAKLHTRYIDGIGYAAGGIGVPSLSIHRKVITPRWTLIHYFGYPDLRNRTPEVQQRGRNSEEFGDSFVRLEWRPIYTLETFTQQFGRALIADKTRRMTVPGFNAQRVSDKLTVVRTGAPPYTLQFIELSRYDSDGDLEGIGYGIQPPGGTQANIQVPRPTMNQQVLYVRQDNSDARYGTPAVRANSIRVEPGYQELLVGEPMVTLKIRRVTVAAFPNADIFEPSRARVTPHTIYAVLEAPAQAIRNHSSGGLLHAVRGMVFGNARVTLYHRRITRVGQISPPSLPSPRAYNRRAYIRPTGFSTMRFGWHLVPGPQDVEHFNASNTMVFGATRVSRPPYVGPQTVRGAGFNAAGIPGPRVEFFHREVRPQGFVATLMGTRLPGDSPYMWQGLRIGPLMPTRPTGINSQTFGGSWASMRVREIRPEGFDHFASEYDYQDFAKRMIVRHAPVARPFDRLLTEGRDSAEFGVPSVRPGRHYIRPDGNADQHRKGVWQ